MAQRANKKKRVSAIHAKVKNRRADAIHKFTTQLVREHSFIVVGNVSSSSLAKTKMANSVLTVPKHTVPKRVRVAGLALTVGDLHDRDVISKFNLRV